jgi:hypothetical protein
MPLRRPQPEDPEDQTLRQEQQPPSTPPARTNNHWSHHSLLVAR